MKKFWKNLKIKYDYIIVDTAPFNVSNFTFLISDLADATILCDTF